MTASLANVVVETPVPPKNAIYLIAMKSRFNNPQMTRSKGTFGSSNLSYAYQIENETIPS
jgi:hypothetical protein